MKTLIESQTTDALAYMRALREVVEGLPDDPEWGGGLRLILPNVIPLSTDYAEDKNAVAWLVANDFNGYDLATSDPSAVGSV